MPSFPTFDFTLYDPTDTTKQLMWNVSALTTSTLRVMKVQGFPGALVTQTIPAIELANVFTANNNFQLGAAFSNVAGATTPISIDTTSNTTNAIDVVTTSGVGSSSGDPTFMNVNGHICADHFVLADLSDNTKQISHDVSGITAATTRSRRYLDTSGSGVVVGSAGTGSAFLDVKNLTGQSAAIGATNLVNGGPTGQYLIFWNLGITTTDGTAGTVQVQINYTDDVGATNQTGTAVALTGSNRDDAGAIFYLASGNVTFQTNVVGAVNAARYALRIRCMYLG